MNQKNNILGKLKMDEVFEIPVEPKPKPVKRAVSEERKKQLIEQLRKARLMRKTGKKTVDEVLPTKEVLDEPKITYIDEPVEQPKKTQPKKKVEIIENDNTEQQKETYLKSLVYKTEKSTNKIARPTRKPIVKKDVHEPKEQPKIKEEQPKIKEDIPTTPSITIQQPIAPTPIVKYTFKKPKWA